MMNKTPDLGRLERIDLRQGWPHEAGDFTPWLAKEENLSLLADVIDMELEVEATEKQVGPFSADILCKDTRRDHWVVIENQLERTDHTHLGQIVTYGAGLGAMTIVWIAAEFRDEHRAALDWLNEISGEKFAFFGLELELWRIGDSLAAPKFNVVVEPNEWSKAVISAAASAELNERQLRYRDFYTTFLAYCDEQEHPLPVRKLPKSGYLGYRFTDRPKTSLAFMHWASRGCLCTQLEIGGEDADGLHAALVADKDSIEAEIGEKLNWDYARAKAYRYVWLESPPVVRDDSETWTPHIPWALDRLVKFEKVFEPRIEAYLKNSSEA